MGRYCDNCDHWREENSDKIWGTCKITGRTTKGSNSCDDWK